MLVIMFRLVYDEVVCESLGNGVLNIQIDSHKKTILQVFLVGTVLSGFVFAFMNQARGQYVLAGLEVGIALISVFLLGYMYKTKDPGKLKYMALFYILMFLSIMMYAFSTEKASISIFIWALSIPLISYLLLGVKTGFVVTAIFYVITFGLFLRGFRSHPMMSEHVSYGNAIISALLFWLLSHSYEQANQSAKEKLRKMALFDHLTGMYNRTFLEQLYNEKLEETIQQGSSLSLVLFDLDHFKRINDQFGHSVGDEVLVRFSEVVAKVFQEQGLAFRIGGEEFIVLLSMTDELEAKKMAEDVRSRTEDMNVVTMRGNNVSVSVGIAVTASNECTIEHLMKQADERMYQAKELGRNLVVN